MDREPIVLSDRESRHRPDIDGLRAIAILSVLGFHAFGAAISGGFVGVDIFFVISGYLISGIILRGLASDRFRFSVFYARRIRRIFPALALVLAVTGILGWYSLLPDEFERLGKEMAAGAGFVSNVLYWKETGYFDQASSLKPLLHLWTLGIEEQFYLIWPLLLAFAWHRRLNLFAVTALLLLASFILNVARVQSHEAATFYLIFTRFWELALGGAYACLEEARLRRSAAGQQARFIWIDRAIARHAPLCAAFASAVGMLLILLSIFMLRTTTVFPGWWAAPPTLGTLMLIAAGPNAWINRHILAASPMVFVGLIGYPLYVWHWPLLSLATITGPAQLSTSYRAALLLVAGVLAWATYRWIEKPIRTRSPPTVFAYPLLFIVAALGIAGLLACYGAIPPRSAGHGLERIVSAANAVAFPGPRLVDIGNPRVPLLRQQAGSQTVVFMGDSLIEQYYPRIDELLQADPAHSESVVFASSGGCPPIPGVEEAHHRSCSGLVDLAERYVDDPSVNRIVIGANWLGYFAKMDPRYSYYFRDAHGSEKSLLTPSGSELSLAALQSMMMRLKAKGKALYLVLQSPSDDDLDPRGLIAHRWGPDSFRLRAPLIRRSTLLETMEPIDSKLRVIASAVGATVIDPLDYLCSDVCPAMTEDGLPMYRDDAHLNPAYVRRHVTYLDKTVRTD